ncbi:MAG: tetratricopeptide repeat protein [Treponema sp.]|jgi:tetratricopeptide (TPR) repeat protein|nr:tetratricopeptide repeat protein [Treponema sp.]
MKNKEIIVLLLISCPLFAQSPSLLYEQGRSFMVQEDWYSASEALLESLRLNPSHAEAAAALAECYYALEEFDEALVWVKKARVLARGNIGLANLEAFILISQGQLEKASAVVNETLTREPYNKEALFAASELDIARGRAGDAVKRYQDAVKRYPDDRRLLVSLALVLGSLGNGEQARVYIERAIHQHPDDYRIYYYAAYLDAEAGSLGSAVNYAERALFYKPDFPDARSLLANLRYRTSQFAEAERLADEAIMSNQKDINARYLKGMAVQELGRLADARAVFASALAIDPNDEFTRIALENRIIKDTSLEDPLRTRWASFHFDRARAYRRQNLSDQALFEYRRGLRINPYARDRKEYAEILKLQGYPSRHTEELRFMQEIGIADKGVDDIVEAYNALLMDAPFKQWGIDPAVSVKKHWNMAVFSVVSQSSVFHADAGALAASYIKDILVHDRNIAPLELELRQASFSQAFREARTAGADYFLVVSVNENQRDISVKGELFTARTGASAGVFSAYRTGADRLRNASVGLVDRVSASLPLRAELLQYKQGQGLIDKGKVDGVKPDMIFDVVQKGHAVIKNDGVGVSYSADDVVGKLTINMVDEEVAAGSVARNGFFDRIAVGDEIFLHPEKSESEAGETLADPELRSLLRTLR